MRSLVRRLHLPPAERKGITDLKRYRLLPNMQLDFRRNAFQNLPKTGWASAARNQGYVHEFGEIDFEKKVERFVEVPPPDMRLLWPNLRYEEQTFDAFVLGNFYPALTGACCLAEAALNMLVLRLRVYFKETPVYKRIYRKKSFDDWPLMIGVLHDWKVLSDQAAEKCTRLLELRLESVHLGELHDAESKAKEALTIYSEVIASLFSTRKDFVFRTPGEIYLKKEVENMPVIQEFLIPKSWHVGFMHQLESDPSSGAIRVVDESDYEDREVSDDEFRELRIESSGAPKE